MTKLAHTMKTKFHYLVVGDPVFKNCYLSSYDFQHVQCNGYPRLFGTEMLARVIADDIKKTYKISCIVRTVEIPNP